MYENEVAAGEPHTLTRDSPVTPGVNWQQNDHEEFMLE